MWRMICLVLLSGCTVNVYEPPATADGGLSSLEEVLVDEFRKELKDIKVEAKKKRKARRQKAEQHKAAVATAVEIPCPDAVTTDMVDIERYAREPVPPREVWAKRGLCSTLYLAQMLRQRSEPMAHENSEKLYRYVTWMRETGN